MKKISLKTRQLLFSVSNLEKKHKLITYVSLLFLTISTYFLRSENQKVKIKFATLQERNKSLKGNMMLYNQSMGNFPLPVWQKVKRGNRFIVQYVNPKYVDMLGHLFKNGENASAHIGKNNFELFPQKYAQEFYEKDLAVAITGKRLNSLDEIFDKEGKKAYIKVVKWRQIKDNKDTLIYGMVKEFIPFKKTIK